MFVDHVIASEPAGFDAGQWWTTGVKPILPWAAAGQVTSYGEDHVKLYVHAISPNARRARVCAKLCHLPVEEVVVDLFGGEQRQPEFLALNPNGKVPVLVDGDFVLCESNAIAQYFALKVGRFDLCPQDPRLRSKVVQWQCWELAHFSPPIDTLISERLLKPSRGGVADPAVEATAEKEFRRFAKVLDAQLTEKIWLLGETLTLADVAVAPALMHADAARLPIAEFPALSEWFARFTELDAWRETSG